jgi:hypothetical protein
MHFCNTTNANTGDFASSNAEKSDTPLDGGNPLTLEIFIICHNRPGQAKEAIQSVLNQNSSDYLLIVSDNSSDDTVEEMVRTHFPPVVYRRRSSALPALAHFNACISEAAADYFCLFHDDDTMREDFVSNVVEAIALHPTAVAFGTNACVTNIPANTKGLSFLCLGRFEQISSPADLFRRYFGRYHTGIAPFPGYVYKTAKIEGKRIPEDGRRCFRKDCLDCKTFNGLLPAWRQRRFAGVSARPFASPQFPGAKQNIVWWCMVSRLPVFHPQTTGCLFIRRPIWEAPENHQKEHEQTPPLPFIPR